MKKPTVLMILDGYGLNDCTEGNAVAQAKTPNMDRLMQEYPFVKGSASGLSVGLPEGQMGNSEVGHLNMGAGRIVYQDLTKITKSIEDGDFYDNYYLKTACQRSSAAVPCICGDCFPMAACTATIRICMPCWSWRREMVWKMSMCIALWMAVILRRLPVWSF